MYYRKIFSFLLGLRHAFLEVKISQTSALPAYSESAIDAFMLRRH